MIDKNEEKQNEEVEEIDVIDPDIEVRESATGENGAILTEQYDIPPVLEEEESEYELNSDPIHVKYIFTGDDVKEGLAIFQGTVLRKKRIIYSLIVAGLFVMYMVNIINNPTNRLSLFLAVVCVAIFGVIWYMPKLHINKTAKAVDDNPVEYEMTIYNSCINVGKPEKSVTIGYDKQITQIFDTINLFLICAGKEQIFILPKRDLVGDKEARVKEIFENAVKERYIIK